MIGWLGDFFRFWWGLIYWNARKTYYRLRRGRTPCPCQNPSDSGRARETGCDAAQHWRRPARFRHVCPLLVETPGGLRCSVSTADVRPFWGRAVVCWTGAAAALYLAGVLGAFVFLRAIGYPLSPLALAWPPRWHQIRLARSEYFAAKARRAFEANRVNEAMLSLDVAYRSNPRNYAIGLQLAQLLSLGQPAVANRLFFVLLRDHPNQSAATAEAWFRALLSHGDFARIADLASQRLLKDVADRPAWLNALLIATRLTGTNQPLVDLMNRKPPALPDAYVNVLDTELLIRAGNVTEALPALTELLPAAAGPYPCYYQVRRLIALDRPAHALSLLDLYASAGRLGPVEDFQLRLDALAGLGRGDLLRARLETGRISLREVELISAHLVRHPDAAVLAAFWDCVQRSRLPADTRSFGAHLSLFVACGVAGDWEKLDAAATRLKDMTGSQLSALGIVEDFFKQKSPLRRIENIVPALPNLPLESVYALYDRYYQPAEPPVLAPRTAPP